MRVQHCEGCGFTYDSVDPGEIPDLLSKATSELTDRVEAADPALIQIRPEPDVWSVLEYACHLRDVFLVQRDRVISALVEEMPSFQKMHRDERVEVGAYRDEPATFVVASLKIATSLFGELYGRLSPVQLERRCVYGYPVPTERDLIWVGRHTLHEAVHHSLDVETVLERVRS
jgi:DNA segregation ATPase FtsK/SpoIIIE, S-DNA-T family